ncbi:TIGR03086 family metal-binding protein [Actinomycetospora sp.]|uniref:TIGR03086 family metal-binding protein n=1 Tax=Actinomycetospora sp. TaxID=1872135 RepID=UPI002F3FCA11
MTTTPGPVADLERALGAATTIVDGVPEDRHDAPSPCGGWTVADVVEHVITGNHGVAAALDPALAGTTDDDSLAGRFRDSSARAVTAFAAPGALSGTVTVPFGTVPVPVALGLRTVEALVHGWDVAVASGQDPAAFPEDLAQAGIAFTESMFATADRTRLPFAPAVPVDATAPAIDRLAGLLGRTDPRR